MSMLPPDDSVDWVRLIRERLPEVEIAPFKDMCGEGEADQIDMEAEIPTDEQLFGGLEDCILQISGFVC
ncbi:hypothetical protein NECAME_00178 [Necator americanus]|uniref:Uncharacterized protein n=1 Tax=Necator americanus TaxID=51031 RepID=W2TJ72_NECAM|nr:hypothetical protein NECAME_00178 [Necator americanus]ETN81828.1 hypothetical protein NECAME_00178 [Necator americanus]